jgi:hypothetical protein
MYKYCINFFLICQISHLPFDGIAWGDVSEGDLTNGNTAEEFVPETFSLGLGFFGLTLFTSEAEGRFDKNKLSFIPRMIYIMGI